MYFEQIFRAAPNKIGTVRPFISHLLQIVPSKTYKTW